MSTIIIVRRKLITALSLLLVFSVLFGTQIAATASANTNKNHPLTSPITFFQITGKVTYKFFKFFSGSNSISNAPGVKVEAENIFDHHKFQTNTDGNGNYVLPINETGVYLVKPSGGNTNIYVPPLRAVKVNDMSSSANNIDFQGLILH
jgi:hypothetical protein